MKNFIILAILLLAIKTEVFGASAPSLGSVSSFAAFTINGAIANSGPTVI